MNKRMIAIAGSLLLLAACSHEAPDYDDADDDTTMEETMDDQDDQDDMMHDDAAAVDMMMHSDARIIGIDATDWAFTPDAISAKKGEEVVLRITGVSGVHGLAIPELGVNVKVPLGETVDVMLPTDTVGTFGAICSVPCGKGHKDMHVMVTITE
ncbi:cupredoxin domain-containing protein [Candidatus Peribacteria bacterium]|nr:cupredoxin domain-containing protein [Candidatus Peribacteria bacterium]